MPLQETRTRTVRTVAASLTLTAATALAAPVAAAQTSDASVVINEVRHDPSGEDQWVELANPDCASAIDVSGWAIEWYEEGFDDPAGSTTVADNTVIEPGGYLVIEATESSELDFRDYVYVTDRQGNDVDWSTPADWGDYGASWARVPDVTGEFAFPDDATPGESNDGTETCSDSDVPDGPGSVGSSSSLDAVSSLVR